MIENEEKQEPIEYVLAEMCGPNPKSMRRMAQRLGNGGWRDDFLNVLKRYASRIGEAWKRECENWKKIECELLAKIDELSKKSACDSSETRKFEVGTEFELCKDVERVLEIGRDFQKQDSWRGAQHDTAKLLCDTIEFLRGCLAGQVGNSAAMREALDDVLEWRQQLGKPKEGAK